MTNQDPEVVFIDFKLRARMLVLSLEHSVQLKFVENTHEFESFLLEWDGPKIKYLFLAAHGNHSGIYFGDSPNSVDPYGFSPCSGFPIRYLDHVLEEDAELYLESCSTANVAERREKRRYPRIAKLQSNGIQNLFDWSACHLPGRTIVAPMCNINRNSMTVTQRIPFQASFIVDDKDVTVRYVVPKSKN